MNALLHFSVFVCKSDVFIDSEFVYFEEKKIRPEFVAVKESSESTLSTLALLELRSCRGFRAKKKAKRSFWKLRSLLSDYPVAVSPKSSILTFDPSRGAHNQHTERESFNKR